MLREVVAEQQDELQQLRALPQAPSPRPPSRADERLRALDAMASVRASHPLRASRTSSAVCVCVCVCVCARARTHTHARFCARTSWSHIQ